MYFRELSVPLSCVIYLWNGSSVLLPLMPRGLWLAGVKVSRVDIVVYVYKTIQASGRVLECVGVLNPLSLETFKTLSKLAQLQT